MPKPKRHAIHHDDINSLCLRCYKECKQFATSKLIKCPKFEHKSVQLEIPLFKGMRKKQEA